MASATPPKQKNVGSSGSAPTQKPKTSGTPGAGRGSSAPVPAVDQKVRGYANKGYGAAPANGSGNKVPR